MYGDRTRVSIEKNTSAELVFHVTLKCDRPYKSITANVGARVMQTFRRPTEGLVTLQVFGQLAVNVGDTVTVEIELPENAPAQR